MPTLNIPYRSQWAGDADKNKADCGPTCVAMILNHFQFEITPDGVYDHLPAKEPEDFTFVHELRNVLQAHGLKATRRQYDDWADAYDHLRANIDAGNPLIGLIKYQPWIGPTGNKYQWGHFVVITGYDDTHITIHDPLFGLWVTPADKGAHFALPHELFAAGWGGFPANENPNWVCLVVGEIVTPPPEPAPVPTPVPVPPPPPPDPRTMEDIQRRIRALAAYRWTEPPDFADESAVMLWRDHLGDWGLTYDEYVVQPGDMMVLIAARFFGQQHRWPAIKAYNDLQDEMLWVGQALLIPHLGNSEAHKDPHLPSDTILRPLAMNLDDPDLKAQDYDALGSGSIGIGF